METISSSEMAARSIVGVAVSDPRRKDTARFSMWPLPDLRLSMSREYEIREVPEDVQRVAYERGYAEGLEEGKQQAQSAVADSLRALRTACERIEELQRRHEGENERVVHALAVAIAEQIIQREISLNPSIVEEFVRHAIADVGDQGGLSVRMHPDDLSIIEESSCWESTEKHGLSWVEDATLTRGGCVVEAPGHTVDGRIEAILKKMFQRLSDV